MASGMEMLLKQLGLDPKKLVADFERMQKNIVDHISDQNAKLARIESKLDLLLKEGEITWTESKPPLLKQ